MSLYFTIYPSLCRLAKHVLLIPHSIAYCEALFSMVKKMTTDQRSMLGRGKEGHAKSSVYEDMPLRQKHSVWFAGRED